MGTLWILRKYCCKTRYDSIIPPLSYILPELWESLLAVVRGQYDTTHGSSEIVLKKRKKYIVVMSTKQEYSAFLEITFIS